MRGECLRRAGQRRQQILALGRPQSGARVPPGASRIGAVRALRDVMERRRGAGEGHTASAG